MKRLVLAAVSLAVAGIAVLVSANRKPSQPIPPEGTWHLADRSGES